MSQEVNPGWQMTTRDDSQVTKHLYRGKIDQAHSLEEDVLLDEFFAYLKDIGRFEINEVLILSGAQIRDTPDFLEAREEIFSLREVKIQK